MYLEIVEGYATCAASGDVEGIAWLEAKLTITIEGETISFLDIHTNRRGNFPSGLLAYLLRLAASDKVAIVVKALPPRPIEECPTDVLRGVSLRSYQVVAVKKALHLRRGIFNIATGGGKTETFIAIAALLEDHCGGKGRRTSLTILPSKISAKQTYGRFKERGLTSVGLVSGSRRDFKKKHVVANYKTLAARLKADDPDARDLLRNVCAVFFDECHHLGTSPSWQTIAKACQAEFRFGFSGTPFTSGIPIVPLDSLDATLSDFRLVSQTGEVIIYTPSKLLRDHKILVDPKIYVLPVFSPNLYYMPFPRWKTIYKKGITENAERNRVVINVAYKLFKRGHRVCILITAIDHGIALMKELVRAGLNVAFSKGNGEVLTWDGDKISTTDHEDAQEEAQAAFSNGEIDLLVCSVVYDESVDLPAMSALVLASGMKSPVRAIQRIGRSIRRSEGKEEAIVVDFRDKTHYFLDNHTNKRLKMYSLHEYSYEEMPSVEAFFSSLPPIEVAEV
jgi:superfamily II DNA or RNA helicase